MSQSQLSNSYAERTGQSFRPSKRGSKISSKKDTKNTFKIDIEPKHGGDYKKYRMLKDKLKKLDKKSKESLKQAPLESFDPNLQEGLIMAMSDMIVYR